MGYINALTFAAARAARTFSTPITRTTASQSGQHGHFTIRAYAPCRYGDPHENAAKILKEKKLDRYAFYNWQDLANFFAKNGDPRGIAKASTYARQDGEHVFIPRFNGPIISIDPLGKDNLTPSEIVKLLDSQKILKAATDSVKNKKLDGKVFTSWAQLRNYLFQIDEWRLHQELLSCKECEDVPTVDVPPIDIWDVQFADAQAVLPDQNGNTEELADIIKKAPRSAKEYEGSTWLGACVDCHDQTIGAVVLDKEAWMTSFIRAFPHVDRSTAEKAWRLSITAKSRTK